jgi:hypothetical protein
MTTNTIPQVKRWTSIRDEIQTSISVGDIHVEGNVQGNIVVGNHNVIGDNNIICEVNNSHGVVIELHTPPDIKRRKKSEPPRLPPGFIGREEELAFLEQRIAERGTALVFAHDGIGKTYLVKKVAHSVAANAMPDGIVNVVGLNERRTLGLEDIFQRLFDKLYESSPPVKVTPSLIQAKLNNVQALVILDDLELSSDILNKLPDLLPSATLIATSEHEFFDYIYEAVPLLPLDREKSIELFAEKSGISLENVTHAEVDRICSVLDDIPLAVAIIANAVRQKRLPFGTLADDLASVQPPSRSNIQAAIDRSFGLIYSVLESDERDMLAYTAAAPGHSVDRPWLESLAGGERTSQALESLELLYTNSPRLRLPDGIRQTLRSGLRDLPERQETLLQYLLGELETRSQDFAFVSAELGNILGLLQWTRDQGHWSDVVALGKAVDPYLTLHGLWDAWKTVLKQVMEAGEYLQNLAVRGWALHQLGTREIGVGGPKQATNLLLRALEIRAYLGDRYGVAYTLHNLNLLLPPLWGNSSDGSDGSGDKPSPKPVPRPIPGRVRRPIPRLVPKPTPILERLFEFLRKIYSQYLSDNKIWRSRVLLLVGGILLAVLVSLFAFRPSLTITEEAGTTRFNPIGQVIEFTYTIDNTGLKRLPGPISVTSGGEDIYCEPLEAIGNGDAFLDWNEIMHCNGQYTITESDVKNGSVNHTSQAAAGEKQITSKEKTIKLNFDPRFLSLDVKPNKDGYVHVGEEVKYSFVLSNIGRETLEGPFTVRDDRMNVSCPDITTTGNQDISLDPDEILICNAIYAITKEDIAKGKVTNTSSASAGRTKTEPVTVTIYRQLPATSLALSKSVDRETYQDVGEEIHYDYVVTNPGNERLPGPVIVVDDKVEVVCTDVQKVGNQDDWLDPGENIACSAIYTITGMDIKLGSVTNTAQASADDIQSEKQTATIYFKTSPPNLTLSKFTNQEFYSEAGEQVRYMYVVSNDGDTSIPGPITVSDDKLNVQCPDLDRVGNQDESLDQGEELICTASYTISVEDVRSGSITNSAWAKAAGVVSEPQTLTIHRKSDIRAPAILSLSKYADRETYVEAGEEVHYNYLVSNEGIGSIPGPVTVEDDRIQTINCLDLEKVGDQDNILDPGETVTCTGTYVISEEDVRSGSVTNTAQASARGVSSSPSTATIYEKALNLSISTDWNEYKDVNEEINYTYTITSRSKSSLDMPLTVVDNRMRVNCPEFSTVGNQDSFFDWDETINCSAIYMISQADIDISQPDAERGSVTNQAVAYSGEVKSNQDSHMVTGPIPAPALSLTHTADPPHYDSVDQVITYTYIITNTGNVTLSPELMVADDDNVEPALNCNSENQMLSPNETATCTNTYTISQADFNYGSSFVTKNKSASGSYRGQRATSPPASITVSCLYPREGWVPFTVSQGETLDQVISWYNGIGISDIQKANCMGSVNQIFPGQTLYVPGPPPTAGVSGTVRDSAGQPLSGITVTLIDYNGAIVQPPQVTGRNGIYAYSNLGPGTYRIFEHLFTLYRNFTDTQDFVIVPTTP